MIRILVTGLIFAALTISTIGCGGISEEKYIDVMADFGCQGVTELDAKAQEIYAKQGVTQKDIDKFRRGMKRETVKSIADGIVQKVAACRGVDLKALGAGHGQES